MSGLTETDMTKKTRRTGAPRAITTARARRAACVSLLLALCVPPQLACAQARDTTAHSDVGSATRAWLELQRSNTHAAPAQPMPGVEAGYAYQRYLKSLNTEIPASFGSSLTTGGPGSNPGGMSNATAGAH
jgi:hypothetical protein